MARKVTDISNDVDSHKLLSQTPKNYDRKNFYLKELQDKVDADWPYRFNRIDVDFEQNWGENDYSTLEVVQQHVKSDTGVAYTDDYRRLVFKNIRENRFNIGNKFRFMADNTISNYQTQSTEVLDRNDPRDIWLVTNFSSIKPSASVIVTRCNGILGSIWLDSQNIAHNHYESIINPINLTATNLFYNQVAVSPQSGFEGLVQYNKYTKNYYINQRFIIGVDKVYRIKSIDKFYGKNTNNPDCVGLMKIYFEVTEKSEYDDFDTMIAYQSTPNIRITEGINNNYSIKIIRPEEFPTALTFNSINFEAYVYQDNVQLNDRIEVSLILENLPVGVSLNKYVTCENINDNTFVITKVKPYLNKGDLIIKIFVPAERSPSGVEISAEFKLSVRGMN